jgi:peptide/nickel transport system substrate-binding protein
MRVLVAVAALWAAAVVPLAGQEAQVVRVALNGYENNVTPFTMTFGSLPNTHDLIMLVHDSLFWSQVLEEPEPWLAESAEPNEDFTEWTVRLREGVLWHDGEPLTAEDVKFTFDYYQEHTGAAGRYDHHVGDVPKYASSEVVDELTVLLRFEQPAPAFKIMPGADLPILPKHVWGDIAEPKTNSEGLPVGSGPFKLTEMVPDQSYVLEANEDYFMGRPLVDRLELPIVKDPATAFAALSTGEVDAVARNLPPELAQRFGDDPDIAVAEGTKFESNQMYFNARKAPLDDAQLRKAISLAVDTQALVDTVLLGRGRPGLPGFVHPDSVWSLPGRQPEHDPAAAKALLDEAGYAEGADGVRTGPDGAPLRFSILVNSFEPQDLRAAQLVAQQVADIGVVLEPEALDPATLRERRRAPDGGVPPYDIYISVLEQHAHVDPDALYYFFHSPGPKGFGAAITGWGNPRFDELAEQATVAGPEERKRLYAEMQQILAAESPAIVLWYLDGAWAYRPAAFDGWVADFGHGIFTKRSFLPGTERMEAAEAGSDAGGEPAEGDEPLASDASEGRSALTWVLLLGIPALGVGLVVSRRRNAGALDEEE